MHTRQPKLVPTARFREALIFIVFLSFFFAGCSNNTTTTPEQINVEIRDSDQTRSVQVLAGSTVQEVLAQAKISLNALDRVDPSTFTVLSNPITITITRVEEVFETEEAIIPFQRQTVRNESLPDGESMLIQPGINGVQQITYRSLKENGKVVNRSLFKVEDIMEAQPEIVMVGVQSPYSPMVIPGTLAYLTAGNAWVMQNSTGERRPVVTTGDLDGRVFVLSPDNKWLMFTRKSEVEGQINSLWIVNLETEDPTPVSLRASNIIHFAGFDPTREQSIFYSTVEPRAAAPGWQANNDLIRISFYSDGSISLTEEIIATNSGGIYGWWGTNFRFSPDGTQLAYARPDSVGLVDTENGEYNPLVDLIPFQTRSDWAWVPGIAWAPDSEVLYTVTHSPLAGLANNELSPLFNLSGIVLTSRSVIDVYPQSGMFAYPALSNKPGNNVPVAFLDAIFPEQSETSRYRLALMDPDGSNYRVIFPPEGSNGLDPQYVVWSPMKNDIDEEWLGFVYQGNIWLLNVDTGEFQQVTGDGLVTRIDWK